MLAVEPLGPVVLNPEVPSVREVISIFVVAPATVIAIQLPWLLSPVGAD